MAKPLDGLCVLDLTRVLAGPFAGMLLADMGADVIKVENPKGGDDSRAFSPFKNGVSAYFMGLKRSVTINLKLSAGKALFERLIPTADVLIENFKPGTMKKLGLDYEALRPLNPRLIYAASSGFGQTGPFSSKAAYDLIIQGLSGFMSITGFDAGHPVKAGSSIADIFAGVFTVIGILAALENRHRTGKGQMVDVAMLDCMVAILENAIASYDCTGKSPEPLGNGHRSISPFAAFPTADGLVNICAGNDDLWRRLCEVAGMERYIADERFRNNRGRVENFPELFEVIAEHLRKRTTAEWIEALDEVKVPCGAIQKMEEVVRDPQVLARQMVVHMEHPEAGSLLVPGIPIKFSDTPAGIKCPAPALGQHNGEVFGKLLGIDADELARLREQGAI